MAPDKSHAFIRILSDLNTINEENFRDRTDNDHRITKNCQQLDFNQIILCKANQKHHYSEIDILLVPVWIEKIIQKAF